MTLLDWTPKVRYSQKCDRASKRGSTSDASPRFFSTGFKVELEYGNGNTVILASLTGLQEEYHLFHFVISRRPVTPWKVTPAGARVAAAQGSHPIETRPSRAAASAFGRTEGSKLAGFRFAFETSGEASPGTIDERSYVDEAVASPVEARPHTRPRPMFRHAHSRFYVPSSTITSSRAKPISTVSPG